MTARKGTALHSAGQPISASRTRADLYSTSKPGAGRACDGADLTPEE